MSTFEVECLTYQCTVKTPVLAAAKVLLDCGAQGRSILQCVKQESLTPLMEKSSIILVLFD